MVLELSVRFVLMGRVFCTMEKVVPFSFRFGTNVQTQIVAFAPTSRIRDVDLRGKQKR